MRTKPITRWWLSAVIFAIGLSFLGAIPVAVANDDDDDAIHLSLDVAQDGFSFKCINPPDPVSNAFVPCPAGGILEGATFIVQGAVYPGGTLDGMTSGANPDGTPSMPEKVIGEWSCTGWLLVDAGALGAEGGIELVGTQIFVLNNSEWIRFEDYRHVRN